ncbi:hypothetical protein PGTUg99_022521 [Puccinia graminis f. sp. tritici]|uniref:Uncharacterized protein n=1 Tax=Puccinia graminis f. sp. tritici TaxID=56615 RepID=A0A5B0SJA9_PUCGR|nr:hypothetical protein PGTUg99_022521 [Puccinia graminis f. sp. tritici]
MKLSNSIKQQIVVAIQLCWLSSALNGAPMIEKLKCCFCGARDPKPIGSGAEVENPSALQSNPTVIKPQPNFSAPSDLPVFPVVSNLPHDNFNPISESGSNGSNGSIYPSMTSLSKPVSKPTLVAPTATTIETKYNSHEIQDTNQPPTAFQATAVDMQSALGMGHIMDGMGENNLDIGPLYPQVHMPNGQNFPRPISGTNLFNFVTPYQGNHALCGKYRL